MLQVSGLTRRYGDFVAVDGVSFTVRPGEIIGLLGHNGAGKTTMMKMLSCFLEPDSGSVALGDDVLANNRFAIQQQLGYLPESLPVYPEMTVVDYLDYAADLKNLTGDERWSEIRRVVDATDLASKLTSTIADLSRGYRQRVGLAQALLGKPRLLILDEPSNGLDPEQTRQMRDLIRTVAKDATVILSTHVMQEVEALCSRVLLMSHGELKVDAPLAQLQQAGALILETDLELDKLQSLAESIGLSAPELLSAGETGSYQYRVSIQIAGEVTGEIAGEIEGDIAGEVAGVGGQDEPLELTLQKQAAQLARAVIGAEGQLFSLQSERRDLETLFHEVSQAESGATKQEVNHAA
ncbi:MAG: ABC transporter ATP-binding protein [Oceanobacter sp.]